MEKETKNKDLEWSLKPLWFCSHFCGVPVAPFQSKTYSIFLRFFIFPTVCLSLIINSFFSMSYLIRQSKIWMARINLGNNVDLGLKIPNVMLEWLIVVFPSIFVVGVPLSFAVFVSFTGRWKEIKNCLQHINEDLTLSPAFFSRSRHHCILWILLSIVELALFSWFSSNTEYMQMNDYMSIFNPSRFLCLFSTYNCNSSQPLVFDQIAIVFGIWIQSSVITVLTIFCILTWLASLIATELKNNGTEEVLKSDVNHIDTSLPSLAVEKWLRDFHLFNRFVEAINGCFGTVLLLTLTNICVTSTYYWFRIVKRLCGESNLDFKALCLEFFLPLALLYFRFFILLFVSRQLQVKGNELKSCLRSFPSSLTNINRQIQIETVALQVSAQRETRINAFYIFELDFAMIPSLIGTTLTYTIVLYVTTFGIYQKKVQSQFENKYSFIIKVIPASLQNGLSDLLMNYF